MVPSLTSDYCKIRFNPASPLTTHTLGKQTAGLQTVTQYHLHLRGGRQQVHKRRGWVSLLMTMEMSC